MENWVKYVEINAKKHTKKNTEKRKPKNAITNSQIEWILNFETAGSLQIEFFLIWVPVFTVCTKFSTFRNLCVSDDFKSIAKIFFFLIFFWKNHYMSPSPPTTANGKWTWIFIFIFMLEIWGLIWRTNSDGTYG